MAQTPLSPKLDKVAPFVWAEYTLLFNWDLIAVGRLMGGIYPSQSAARTGCDHWPSTSVLCGGSAVQGQGGGTLTWPVAVHWVCRLSSFLDGAGQGQPHLCSTWGHCAWAIKQSEMAATCAELGDSQAKPNCESSLAAASARIGPLSLGGSLRPAVACLIGFRKLWSRSQDQSFIWKRHS